MPTNEITVDLKTDIRFETALRWSVNIGLVAFKLGVPEKTVTKFVWWIMAKCIRVSVK